MVLSQMKVDISPPQADEVASIAPEVEMAEMRGVLVILQFAMLREIGAAIIATFAVLGFDDEFLRRIFPLLLLKSPQPVFSHGFLDDMLGRRRDAVVLSEVKVNVSAPETDDVALVAPEVE